MADDAAFTTIQVTKGTRERLKTKRIAKRETHDEVIVRLLKQDDELKAAKAARDAIQFAVPTDAGATS